MSADSRTISVSEQAVLVSDMNAIKGALRSMKPEVASGFYERFKDALCPQTHERSW